MVYPSFRQMKKRTDLSSATEMVVGDSGSVYCVDALTFLRGLPDGVATIVFVDPPFNLQKRYGRTGPNGDSTKSGAYLLFMTQILNEAARVLAPGGSLYVY